MSGCVVSDQAIEVVGQIVDKRRRLRNVSQKALASQLDCCRQTLAGSLLGDPKAGGISLLLRAHEKLDGSVFAFAAALHGVARRQPIDADALALRSSADDAAYFEIICDGGRPARSTSS